MPTTDPAATLSDPPPPRVLRADRSSPGRVTPSQVTTDQQGASLRRFHAFHATLQAITEALQSGNWTALLADQPAGGPLDARLVRAVRTRLMAEIGPPAPGSADTPRIDPGQVMALIADEALLHNLIWPGQQGWAREPLQQVLYGATGDGDQILQVVNAVAAGEANASDDVAQTIRLALDLGYFDPPADATPPPAETSSRPRRLFEIVFRSADPVPAVADDFMTGAVQPLGGLPVMQLPPVRPWRLLLAGLACVYLLVSLLLWWTQVSDVLGVAARVLSSLHPAS